MPFFEQISSLYEEPAEVFSHIVSARSSCDFFGSIFQEHNQYEFQLINDTQSLLSSYYVPGKSQIWSLIPTSATHGENLPHSTLEEPDIQGGS